MEFSGDTFLEYRQIPSEICGRLNVHLVDAARTGCSKRWPPGMNLAANRTMAKMIGNAARYTTRQSIRSFQKMWLTTMLVLLALAFFEGVGVITLILTRARINYLVLGLGLLGVLLIIRLCRDQSERIDRYERERMNWRRGALGEHIVRDTLESLPETYFVLNDIKTSSGNLDHVVVGPTGAFAIETKNWRGVVTADGQGELLINGAACEKPEVRKFLARTMRLRDQIISLARRDVYIRGVMVFPKARVDATFASTGKVHCITEEKLCAYIENVTFSHKLSAADVDQICRALQGIAGMEPEFVTDQHKSSSIMSAKTCAPTASALS